MEEEHSRRKQKRPAPPSKFPTKTVILLLLLNTMVLCLLLFLSFQANAKQEDKLSSIEKQVTLLDQNLDKQIVPTPASTQPSSSVQEGTSETMQTTESLANDDLSISSDSQQQTIETTPTSSSEQEVNTPSTYIVQSGDTLSGIAEKNQISLEDLMARNNLTDTTVWIGQELAIK
ncbi:LysM peptidoglycan-binding domain-containing protein [Enterococcus sp. UD-01]|uniref:LysM peptidoglycan-binding domain-containing protein n=1 Tax=Enterococcus sp. UD-01 TaxID=3373911 RepID=UPI00383464CB